MNESKLKTFTDSGEMLLKFMDKYAVVCPRCQKCARVAVIDTTAPLLFASRKLTCGNCAYTAEWRSNGVVSRFSDEPRDWYFQQPFFYRTACCGHELWIFNRRHLEFLKDFVGAKIRSRSKGEYGWSNRSLASRLPKWISAASHRDDVLAALVKLERNLNTEEKV
jgi:hypothetical protein